MATLASITTKLAGLVEERIDAKGVTGFQEGQDRAEFEPISKLVDGIGKLSDPAVIAALGGTSDPVLRPVE